MIEFSENAEHFASWFGQETLKPKLKGLYDSFMKGSICLDSPGLPENEIVGNKDSCSKKPFILHDDKLYMQRYFVYETRLLEKLASIGKRDECRETEAISFIKAFSSTNKKKLNHWQLVAAFNSFVKNLSIITGGPGTGKTTTVASVLEMLFVQAPKLKVALVAPTGKAANRLAESIRNSATDFHPKFTALFNQIEPSTIHRLLGYIPGSLYFKQNENNLLPHDVIIVDECSMIDVALFAKLLLAIAPGTRLILLGDKDQLSAVEAGSIFGDICKSVDQENEFDKEFSSVILSTLGIKVPVKADSKNLIAGTITSLKESHRFTTHTGIGKLATAVLHNQTEEIKSFFIEKDKDDQVTMDVEYSPELFESFIIGYEAYIKEQDFVKAMKAFNSLRILCATKMGDHGVYSLNRKVEEYLQRKNLIKAGDIYYENRPVMLTQNYNDLQIFNGETGIVRTDEDGNKWVMFLAADNTVKKVLPGYLSGVETAFAMTIHKSQGSEYTNVLMTLPEKGDSKILTAELVYTGITRAKEKVIIQTSTEALFAASSLRVQRASGIAERLNKGEY